VYTSIHTFFPLTVDFAGIAAHIAFVCLAEWHWLAATVAIATNTVLTVTLTVGNSHGAVVHERVGGKNELYLPVTIGATEEINFKLTMLGYIFLTNKDATLVSHVSGWGSRVLIIVTVKLCYESLWRNDPTACWEFLRVVALPDLDLVDIIIIEACSFHSIDKSNAIIVARVCIAHQEIFLTTKENFEPGYEIIW
jgi:hypothetical protein